MFRENSDKNPPLENIQYLMHSAGMGDNIASLTVIKYIVETFNHVNLICYVPDYLENFARHVLPKKTTVRNFTIGRTKYNEKMTSISNQWKVHTAMKTHPIDHAAHMLLDKNIPMANKNYCSIRPNEIDISHFNLPKKYVCINVGATAKPKELSPDIINTISVYCLSMGYTPIYLGKKASSIGYKGKKLVADLLDIDYTKGIDLTEKTNLLEAAAIISGAKCLVGMEGGLTHLAGCTNTHIIASYTFVDPSIMAPIRNDIIGDNMTIITPPASLSCRFCQTNMSFVYHDFRECFYEDFKCTRDLKSDSFIEALEKIL